MYAGAENSDDEVMEVRKKAGGSICKAAQMREGSGHPFGMLAGVTALGGGELEVYRQIRSAVPILDAAIGKLVRLTGGFTAACGNPEAEKGLRRFLRSVNTGRGQCGIESFLTAFLQSMLVYGRAVGEMVVSGNELTAVLWGDVTKLYVQEGSSALEYAFGQWQDGEVKIFPRQNLILFAAWNPDEENPYGTSVFRSMPFLVDVLLKIYSTIGTNWERAGNVRYSVVYKPADSAGQIDAQERSEQIASQWSQAMQASRHGVVRDFVAVGDVEIKVIGADGQILDSEVPVRQILEQLVAKTGLPPFLLGLSWASTERMSAQQTDLLTSELWAIRRTVEPVLLRICRLWLQLHGYGQEPEIVWDEISLQDIVEQAHAQLYLAQAEKIAGEREETV